MKTCTVCNKTKRDNGFFKRSESDALRSQCKECNRNTRKPYYSSSSYKRWKRYKLNQEEYDTIAGIQKGKCKICLKSCKLVVDHCHKTNRVRGLLCALCNTALGMIKEDLVTSIRMVSYIKEFK